MIKMGISYSDAGVDIELGDDASKILYNAAKQTWKNRTGNIGEIIVPTDDFSGVRAIEISSLPEGSFMSMGFDGVGTKVEIAQRMQDHSTIAFDLLAMVCDDAVVRGAEPVLAGSVLDVNSLGRANKTNIKYLRQLALGYISAAKEANVAIINGELAELGDAIGGYGDFKYNWCSGLVWFASKSKMLTGKEINQGDSIVVLKEDGFRSNGLSLVRKILEAKHGKKWHDAELDGEKLGSLVLKQSKIYSKFIIHLHGGFNTEGCCKIHGIAHITGGGIPGKLGRALKPSGFGAELDDLFEPCKAMRYCQELGEVPDKEAYRTWNMGQGMAIITPEPKKVLKEAKIFGIDSKVAGKIIKGKKIILRSQGISGKDKIIEYNL